MRNYLITALLFLSVTGFAQNKERAKPGNIESYIDRFDINNVNSNKNGWAHYYIPRGMADTLTVKMSCVYAGTQTHAPHVHNEDEAFYIVQGPVNFHINGEERILNSGDFIYTPSGSSHNIQRTGADTIKYLVIKRETLGAVSEPYKVGNKNYTYEDCFMPLSANQEWKKKPSAQIGLLDKTFADGFEVVIERISDESATSTIKPEKNKQTAIYIISGEAEIEADGLTASLAADNTFYSPKSYSYALRNKGQEPLIFLSISTE